jgi:acetyl esterase/lipase
VAPEHIVVMGDSAGGGLAVSAALALRAAGDPGPAGIGLIGPWVDLTVRGESMTTNAAVDPVVGRAGLTRAAANYLAGRSATDPIASPLFGDLHGLAPLLIQVGDAEALLDDARRLAARARDAGVDAALEVWSDLMHGWHHYADVLPEGAEAIERLARFASRVTGAPPAP